jgi:glucose dehydrogenase
MIRRVLFALAAAIVCGSVVAALRQAPSVVVSDVDWPVYRGDPGGGQYSPLAQINAANVHRLQPA